MYNALNNPTELTGWTIGGGDPCGDSWKGITCEGSSVVSMYGILNDETSQMHLYDFFLKVFLWLKKLTFVLLCWLVISLV